MATPDSECYVIGNAMSVRVSQGKRLVLRVSLFQSISVCQWHECPGCDSPLRFGGRDSAEQWLRRFKADPAAMVDLRRVVDRVGGLSLLSPMTDDQLIDQVAAM